ncbi:MAG: hypothetical protein M1839_001552 [Geoglossum umbratile]|nr:MAG: hypothetical protein M1839_001552 [Geoglossum umbratile]
MIGVVPEVRFKIENVPGRNGGLRPQLLRNVSTTRINRETKTNLRRLRKVGEGMDDGEWMDWDTQPRGLKRPPEDNLDGEQRLAKRLSLLNLDRSGGACFRSSARSPESQRASTGNDAMQLDDTKHRIYISNLDDELSDDDPQEGKLIFLPDIEKRMTKIPYSILKNPQQPPAPISTNTEVVLYNVPTSLSVPREHDSVRKAIIEARARARERQAQELRNGFLGATQVTHTNGEGNSIFGTTFRPPPVNRFGGRPTDMLSNQKTGVIQPPQTNGPSDGRNGIFSSAGFGAPSINGFAAPSTNAIFANPTQTPLTSGFSEKPAGILVVDPDAMEIE